MTSYSFLCCTWITWPLTFIHLYIWQQKVSSVKLRQREGLPGLRQESVLPHLLRTRLSSNNTLWYFRSSSLRKTVLWSTPAKEMRAKNTFKFFWTLSVLLFSCAAQGKSDTCDESVHCRYHRSSAGNSLSHILSRPICFTFHLFKCNWICFNDQRRSSSSTASFSSESSVHCKTHAQVVMLVTGSCSHQRLMFRINSFTDPFVLSFFGWMEEWRGLFLTDRTSCKESGATNSPKVTQWTEHWLD